MTSNEVQLFLPCQCHDLEHLAAFSYFPADDIDPIPSDVYLTIHLNTYKGFWKRIWFGIKYILGYKSRFGAYDEVIIKFEDFSKIIELFQKAENDWIVANSIKDNAKNLDKKLLKILLG